MKLRGTFVVQRVRLSARWASLVVCVSVLSWVGAGCAVAPSPTSDGEADVDIGAGACGVDQELGSEVAPNRIVGQRPAALGGAIVPGVYDLVSLLDHRAEGSTEPLGWVLTSTLEFHESGAVEGRSVTRFTEPASGQEDARGDFVGTYRTDGATLTFDLTCPFEGTGSQGYSASGDRLILHDDFDETIDYEYVFERRIR